MSDPNPKIELEDYVQQRIDKRVDKIFSILKVQQKHIYLLLEYLTAEQKAEFFETIGLRPFTEEQLISDNDKEFFNESQL